MIVNIREKKGVTIPDIDGKMVGPDSLKLSDVINERIKSMPEGGVRVLLNLANVPVMDSSGLGAIIAAYTSVKRKNGRIALLNAGKSIRSLIIMAKLMSMFDRYDDEDEAIDALQEEGNVKDRKFLYAAAS